MNFLLKEKLHGIQQGAIFCLFTYVKIMNDNFYIE